MKIINALLKDKYIKVDYRLHVSEHFSFESMKKNINLNIELLYMFAMMFDLVFFFKAKICKLLISQNKNENFVTNSLFSILEVHQIFKKFFLDFFFFFQISSFNPPKKLIGEILLPIFKNFLKTCHQLTLIFSFGDGCQPFPLDKVLPISEIKN
jgi:hypothetical protein